MTLQRLVDLSTKIRERHETDLGPVVRYALAESSQSLAGGKGAAPPVGLGRGSCCGAGSGPDPSEDLVTSGGHPFVSRHQLRKVCGAGAFRSRLRVQARKT